ncbi:lipoprotein-releasing ABC transporter permease subunit [Salinisphaera sp. Q1T1-3]|uniref:lipoprotein-releasing ABC transporter permease subunit n=1 Tax=Salinisphaera sp. Q1T1-3 TaxID=2321229 RepID=UPI000E708839|nr:lipoprotein-releasing ABC transporter permease subunit [Salinisphaera sp. Q1T1-3]RJS92035.1 lipoprotein-releasing ABC transporter permease subunit [Salinisphaera sp. Q1T1-3]
MFRPLELYIGLRYTRAKRRNHFISFISSISMGGIALAVMLLITVLSVMNGFQSELRDRILGMAAHVEVQSANGDLQDWQQLRKNVDDHTKQVVASAPYITGQGMVRSGRAISGVMLRGVDPKLEANVSDVASNMDAGSFDSLKGGTYNMLLGKDLANRLGVWRGDDIDVLIPKATVTPAGIVPRFRRFHVSGIFSVGMYEYDSGMALMSMKDAQTLYHMGSGVSGVRLRLDDMFKAPQVSQELSQWLPYRYRVTDWTQQNANFFHAVATEKTMMFIILSLIIAVAVFNIVSMLVMVVTDKQGDIAILRTLGMKPRSVMAIFMIQGMLIGVIGTAIGVVLGILLSVNMVHIVPFVEKVLHTNLFSADVYYISQLKGELHWSDVYRISGLALGLAFLSTLYPAWRAARVQPAEALRYE